MIARAQPENNPKQFFDRGILLSKIFLLLQAQNGRKVWALVFNKKRDISSVGLEHCFHRAGVIGSNPICPTVFLPKGH